MLLHRLYDDALAQASYLCACEKTRAAVVVDPNRDVGRYTSLATSLGVRITRVTETHIHADFVSGAAELAERTGAELCLSAAAPELGYAYDAVHGAIPITNGDIIDVGSVRLEVLHTPGHTPEHLTFLVTDTTASELPVGALTGDFIFVGDVGRPDLLERAVGVAGSADDAARQLFRSLQAFLRQPDYLQIWPGHGAGSACGKSLSALPHSTLGYERLANWALLVDDEDEFVRRVLEDQTEPPAYFAEMKKVNRVGPRRLTSVRAAEQAAASDIANALRSGASVVDTRPAGVFAREHISGTINVPLGKSFVTWAGSVVPYDVPVYVIADVAPPGLAQTALQQLSLIGVDNVRGWGTWADLGDWRDEQFPLRATKQLSADDLAEVADRHQILDVRNAVEWRAGHIPGANHIPLAELRRRISEMDTGRPVVVHCQSGGRSAVAASVLEAAGVESVANLAGGFAAWSAAGHTVEDGQGG